MNTKFQETLDYLKSSQSLNYHFFHRTIDLVTEKPAVQARENISLIHVHEVRICPELK